MFGLLESGVSFFSWGNALMITIGLAFIYLAIAKEMEPLLLIPIGFGVMLVNLPLGGMMDYELCIRADRVGSVVGVSIKEGDTIKKGDILCQLDSGNVLAPVTGRIEGVVISPGQHIEAGDMIASAITMEQTNQSELPTRPVGLLSRKMTSTLSKLDPRSRLRMVV